MAADDPYAEVIWGAFRTDSFGSEMMERVLSPSHDGRRTVPDDRRTVPDDRWTVPVEVMLGSLDHGEVQACSISEVPDMLRGPREDAYKPKLVSVGPLHRGTTRHLLLMEQPKWRYMKDFLDRQGTTPEETRGSEVRLRACATDIPRLDRVVRACYGGNMALQHQELSKIMIVDGCFQLELLLRLGDYMNLRNATTTTTNNSYAHDPFLETKEKLLSVLNDISMLENQVPFIVLKKLYRKVFPDGSKIEDDPRVANVVRKAFGYPLQNSSGAAHILHLMHLSTVEQGQQESSRLRQACQELGRCATRLLAAGITIIPANSRGFGNGNGNPSTGNVSANTSINNQHELVDIFDFLIYFNKNDRVLKIPPLHIKETTEVRWRNLIAWEQGRIWIRCRYTSYALFFKGLICCKHDIELLEEIGVIVNKSKKSKEELLTMFRTTSEGVTHMDSSYAPLCVSLNAHRAAILTKAFQEWPIITWHRFRFVVEIIVYYCRNWYNVLIREHIPTVWKFIGVLAAALLLVLTIMQTDYAAKVR